MSQVVDQVVATVAAQTTVIGSTNALLDHTFGAIQGALDSGNIGQVQQVLAELQAQKPALADAVLANTTPTALPVEPVLIEEE